MEKKHSAVASMKDQCVFNFLTINLKDFKHSTVSWTATKGFVIEALAAATKATNCKTTLVLCLLS
jgi:hypothetical protein